MNAGKGSKQRPTDGERYRDGHEGIDWGIVPLSECRPDPMCEAAGMAALGTPEDTPRESGETVILSGGPKDGETVAIDPKARTIHLPIYDAKAVFDPTLTGPPPIHYTKAAVYERSTLDPLVYRYVAPRETGEGSHSSTNGGDCQDAAWIRKQIAERHFGLRPGDVPQ